MLSTPLYTDLEIFPKVIHLFAQISSMSNWEAMQN